MEIIHPDYGCVSDLDDTLAISESLKEAIYYRALEHTQQEQDMQCPLKYNPGFSTKPAFKKWIEDGASDTERNKRSEFYDAFQIVYMQAKEDFYRNEVTAFEDAHPLVAAIADRPAVLVSSNPLSHLQLGIERLGWTGAFDHIVAVDDPRIEAPKPHKSPFVVGADLTGHGVGRCFGIGDSLADARSMTDAEIAHGYIVHRENGDMNPEVAALAEAGRIKIIRTLEELLVE